jgi:hypothetical protein
METSPSTDAVRAFLAERDRACPGCGYNLRGVEQAQCPECGRGIELEVVGKRDRSVLWFLLLAFGWVLVASAMNGTRAVLEVWEQAKPGPRVIMLGQGTQLLLPSAGRVTTTTVRQFSGGSLQSTITISGGATMTLGGGLGGGAPAATVPQWKNVSTMSWVTLGWWAVLFLGALNFLLALWFVARRRGPEQMRMLVPVAGFVFLCYAGWHIVAFVRELAA